MFIIILILTLLPNLNFQVKLNNSKHRYKHRVASIINQVPSQFDQFLGSP